MVDPPDFELRLFRWLPPLRFLEVDLDLDLDLDLDVQQPQYRGPLRKERNQMLALVARQVGRGR